MLHADAAVLHNDGSPMTHLSLKALMEAENISEVSEKEGPLLFNNIVSKILKRLYAGFTRKLPN